MTRMTGQGTAAHAAATLARVVAGADVAVTARRGVAGENAAGGRIVSVRSSEIGSHNRPKRIVWMMSGLVLPILARFG